MLNFYTEFYLHYKTNIYLSEYIYSDGLLAGFDQTLQDFLKVPKTKSNICLSATKETIKHLAISNIS